MWRLACLVLVTSCGWSGDGRPGATQCEQLRDRLVDNRLAVATGVDKAAHREALRGALGDDFVTRCKETMTEDQVDCALNASHDAALQACKH